MNIKFILIILCGLLFISISGFTQQKFRQRFGTRIVYRMTYKPDSNNLEKVKSEEMELLANDSVSLFRSVNAGIVDSAGYIPYQKGDMATMMKEMSAYPTSFHYSIVKTQADITYSEEILYGRMIAICKEPRDEMHWDLTSDTATINGLHCQKALLADFGHRKWAAWFCSDIPLSDGPYKFCGLPGIIVKIADEKEYWSFTLLGIANAQTNVFINYNDQLPFVNMDKPTYFKNKRYFLFNAYEVNEARGSLNGVDPQVKESQKIRYAKRAKDDNNWIELP